MSTPSYSPAKYWFNVGTKEIPLSQNSLPVHDSINHLQYTTKERTHSLLPVNVPLQLSDIFGAISKDAQGLFFRHTVTKHVETILFQEEVTVRGEVFRVQLEKVGDRERLQQEVLAWLADPNHPTRPPLYKDRPKDAHGNRMNEIEFFYEHYGRFSEAKAIYLDQLRKLDASLANLISQAWRRHQIPVNDLVQPKSERINETLLSAREKLTLTERPIMEMMVSNRYNREFQD